MIAAGAPAALPLVIPRRDRTEGRLIMAGDPVTTFADLELARRLERAEALTCAGLASGRCEIEGARASAVVEVAGAHAVFDGVDSPMTQCFGLGMHREADDAVLDAVEEFYTERGAPTRLEVCPLSGVELSARLVARGYRPIEMSNVLHRPLATSRSPAGAGVGSPVSRICGADEADAWAATAARGWSEYGDLLELMTSVARIHARRADSYSFLVEIGGSPAAAGGLVINDGVAHLAGASTVPEHRRRGAQLALLEHRLRFAAEEGCDVAMMSTEPGSASQRNAQRHGFAIAYTRTKWESGV